MNCPCDSNEYSKCTKCPQKPAITDIAALVKIYHQERETWLTRIDDRNPYKHYGQYWYNVIQDHLHKISQFTTKEELDEDMSKFAKLSFEEWYNSL